MKRKLKKVKIIIQIM